MENEETKMSAVDIEALKKELEGFIAVAKKEKEKIESLSSGITTKSEEIELYYANFSELRTKFTDSQTGMQALLDQSTNLKNKTDQIGVNAQAQLDNIIEKTNLINANIQEIEKYYGVFTELKNKFDDEQTGLWALLDQSTALQKNIVELESKARTELDDIYKNMNSISEKVMEIESFYTSTFLPLREKVENEETGMQAVLGVVSNIKNEIIKTRSGADESFREIKNLADQSLKLKDKSEKSTTEIETLKQRSAEFKNDIEQTFKIATDVSLANSFNERKKNLEDESAKWLKHLSWSTGLLALGVIFIYFSQYIPNGTHPSDWRFWYRFAFTSPIIYYVYFTSHNYNKTRDLLEKYAFKFAASLSLQSYAKLLTDNFKEDKHKEELLSFTIRSIDLIYKEPYAERDKTRKFSVGNKIINIGIEDIETLAKQNIDIVDIIKEKKPNKE
jgi:uncharacterized coiled-coil DUF342 family protein